jgi:hypothetical protein
MIIRAQAYGESKIIYHLKDREDTVIKEELRYICLVEYLTLQ